MTGVEFGEIRFDDDNKARLSTKLLGSIDAGELVENLVKAKEIPITTRINENDEIAEKFTAYDEFEGKVQTLSDAMEVLRRPSPLSGLKDVFSARNVVGVGGSQEAVNSILLTATNDAKIGKFSLTVHQLARQEARATRQHTSETSSIIEAAEAGKLVINGAEVDVNADDSLQDIANRINQNSEAVDATAEVIKLSDNNYRLFVSGSSSGKRLSIEAVDTASGTTALADKLGFMTTTVTSKAGQKREYDQATGTYTGNLISGTIRPDSEKDMSLRISINDYSTANGGAPTVKEEVITIEAKDNGDINDVALAINQNELGVQAEVYRDKDGIDRLRFRTQSDNSSIIGFEGVKLSDRTYTDSSGNSVTVEQVDAADVEKILGLELDTTTTPPETLSDLRLDEEFMAKIEYNGLTAVRDSNKFRDLIPDVTVELFAATGEQAELAVEHNIDGAYTAIDNFVAAFNDLYKYVEFHSQSDEEGKVHEDAILNQTSILRTVRSELTRLISSSAFGKLNSTKSSLGDVGVTINSRNRGIEEEDPGILELDLEMLYEALTEDFTGVQQVFSFVPSAGNNPNFGIIDRPEVISGNTSELEINSYVRDAGDHVSVDFTNSPLSLESIAIGDLLSLGAEPGTRVEGDRIRLYVEDNRNEFIDLTRTANSLEYEVTSVTGSTASVTTFDAVYHQKEVLIGPKDLFGEGSNATYDATSKKLTVDASQKLNVKVASPGSVTYQVGDSLQIGSKTSPGTNHYRGTVSSYDSSTGELEFAISSISGSKPTGDLVIQSVSGTTVSSTQNDATFVEIDTNNYKVGDIVEVGDKASPDSNYYRGKVESYDQSTRELTISIDDSVTKGNGASGDVLIRPLFGEISNTSGNIRGSEALDGFVISYTGEVLFPGETSESVGLSFSRGVADQAFSVFENWLSSTSGGLFFEERESLKSIRDRNLSQIERLQDQLEQYRKRMESEFTNVEKQLAALSTTQATIEQFANSGKD